MCMVNRIEDYEVSIIVAVFNVEKYICRCVDSLLKQTYHNIEIILVDDGSQDNSPEIYDEYAHGQDMYSMPKD